MYGLCGHQLQPTHLQRAAHMRLVAIKPSSVVVHIEMKKPFELFPGTQLCHQSGEVCPEAESVFSLVTAANVLSIWEMSYKNHHFAEKGGLRGSTSVFIDSTSLPPLCMGNKCCTRKMFVCRFVECMEGGMWEQNSQLAPPGTARARASWDVIAAMRLFHPRFHGTGACCWHRFF